MTHQSVIFFDYEHCREFLEQRAQELKRDAAGIDQLALFRELYYSFSYEAIDKAALTLGQFDVGLVFLFVPGEMRLPERPRAHQTARAKALELLGCQEGEPPIILELLASQGQQPALADKGRIERWMRAEFLEEVLLSQRIEIQLYFNGGAFFREVLEPQLTARGFTLLDKYVASARSGELRARHPLAPKKVFRIPWLQWVREMLGGGYSLVYLLACVAAYFKMLDQAIAGKLASERATDAKPAPQAD